MEAAVWSTARLAHGLTLGLVRRAVVLRLAEIWVVHEVREGLALPGNLDAACESKSGHSRSLLLRQLRGHHAALALPS